MQLLLIVFFLYFPV